jgi:hypothetical protein
MMMFLVRLIGAVFAVVGALVVLSPVLWPDSNGSSPGSILSGVVLLAVGVGAIAFAVTRTDD